MLEFVMIASKNVKIIQWRLNSYASVKSEVLPECRMIDATLESDLQLLCISRFRHTVRSPVLG